MTIIAMTSRHTDSATSRRWVVDRPSGKPICWLSKHVNAVGSIPDTRVVPRDSFVSQLPSHGPDQSQKTDYGERLLQPRPVLCSIIYVESTSAVASARPWASQKAVQRQMSLLWAPQLTEAKDPTAAPIGGSACGYQPISLRSAVCTDSGQLHVYASLRLGANVLYCRWECCPIAAERPSQGDLVAALTSRHTASQHVITRFTRART
jgi:hypothetical protein